MSIPEVLYRFCESNDDLLQNIILRQFLFYYKLGLKVNWIFKCTPCLIFYSTTEIQSDQMPNCNDWYESYECGLERFHNLSVQYVATHYWNSLLGTLIVTIPINQTIELPPRHMFQSKGAHLRKEDKTVLPFLLISQERMFSILVSSEQFLSCYSN